jgi:hypothetical protein
MTDNPMELVVCEDCAAAIPKDRAADHKNWHTRFTKTVANAVKAEITRDQKSATNPMRQP